MRASNRANAACTIGCVAQTLEQPGDGSHVKEKVAEIEAVLDGPPLDVRFRGSGQGVEKALAFAATASAAIAARV